MCSLRTVAANRRLSALCHKLTEHSVDLIQACSAVIETAAQSPKCLQRFNETLGIRRVFARQLPGHDTGLRCAHASFVPTTRGVDVQAIRGSLAAMIVLCLPVLQACKGEEGKAFVRDPRPAGSPSETDPGGSASNGDEGANNAPSEDAGESTADAGRGTTAVGRS